MAPAAAADACIRGSAVRDPAGRGGDPILDQRPVPVSDEDRAQMLRPEDVADLIVYVASLPAHVVINEVMITPTWNTAYVDQVQRAGL